MQNDTNHEHHDHDHGETVAEHQHPAAVPHAEHHHDDQDMAAHAEHAAHQHDEHASHDAHAGHGGHVDHTGHELLFRNRFWVCLVLTIPVILYSDMIQMWLGFTMPQFSGSEWIAPIFAVIIFLFGGVPFIQMAIPEIQNRQPGMMLLISLAILVAFAYSLFARFIGEGSDFFWEMATLIDIMLLGHWLEMRSIRQASGALDELAKLLPDEAERIGTNGVVEKVRVDQLQAGDVLLIRPGTSVPADGEIVEGESSLNEALITGESQPVEKGAGDKVIAGTINGDGSLRVRVTATGDQTALAGIMRLVREAQTSKSATQVLADKAAGWLFWISLGVAAITAIAWTVATGFDLPVIERVATVLVIACPHALGLAIPLVVAISTAMAARNGILVRDRRALETARDIQVVVFDKTGTLTEGRFGVADSVTAEGWDANAALALIAVIEGDSEHPIARGIREYAEKQGVKPAAVTSFEAIKGQGIRARSDGRDVYAGGPRLLETLAITPSEQIARFRDVNGAESRTVVYLVVEGQIAAAYALADLIRPQSAEAVRNLKAMGIEVAMLTGDSKPVAEAVARQLGIATVLAEVLPEHKAHQISELKAGGKRVAMVGDGVNDAPALARADVGIAIGSGTDVAIESAGIILVSSDPRDVAKIFMLSRATYRKMIQNLIWAAGYNVFALPLAAGILAPIGILLSPAVGAALMSVSTIVVALNAQLLRRAHLAAS